MSLSKDIVDAIQKANQKKTSAYDSIGTVTRVEDNVAWVHIAGGVDETPVQMTINAKVGDQVQVRVAGGRAWLVGNASSPPTDDTTAKQALDYGKIASDAAQKAVQDSLTASEAAGRAQRTAEAVEGIARHAEEVAESVEGIAQQASEDAEDAKESAGVAKTAADNAVLSLSNVQDVVGVLDWITNHGTMTSQAGETFDENNVYFVIDQNGDYVVGGTRYSLVTEPKAEDIDTYYCLSVDKSIQNYVATHIFVDNEGLWIIPDSGGNKVLIATGGTGKRYETAGTYIVDRVGNDDITLAKFLKNNAQIGQDTSANLKMGFNRLVISDKNKNDFLKIKDLRDENGYATFTETYYGNGSTQFNLGTNQIDSIVSVMVDGVDKTSTATIIYADAISITPAPPSGAVVEITYRSISDVSKEFTFGKRSDSNIGSMSVAFGDLTEASGYYSCAFVYGAKARGRYSFTAGGKANGDRSSAFNSGEANGDVSFASGTSKANGRYSHAQNRGTVAGHDSQTAIGKYNDNKANNAFEIGNGTNDSNRSNAFEVDWSGNVNASGDVEDGQGNVLADKLDASGIFDLIYPVGSYYWTSDGNFSPANTFGGTWEKIDPGVTLVSAGTGYTVQSGTAKDGGNDEITLTDKQMAHGHTYTRPTVVSGEGGHTHTVNMKYTANATPTGTGQSQPRANGTSTSSGFASIPANSGTHNHTLTGGGVADLAGASSTREAFDNMPPYKAAYCWHRTA